ncbi:polyprenyl synthetase family protein, partial [Streptomyces albidoflavus]
MSRAARTAPRAPEAPLAAPGRPFARPPADTARADTARADTARADAVLARCRELTHPALVDAVGQLDPWTGRMAAYALGWRDAGGAPDPTGSGGKGLRQALA